MKNAASSGTSSRPEETAWLPPSSATYLAAPKSPGTASGTGREIICPSIGTGIFTFRGIRNWRPPGSGTRTAFRFCSLPSPHRTEERTNVGKRSRLLRHRCPGGIRRSIGHRPCRFRLRDHLARDLGTRPEPGGSGTDGDHLLAPDRHRHNWPDVAGNRLSFGLDIPDRRIDRGAGRSCSPALCRSWPLPDLRRCNPDPLLRCLCHCRTASGDYRKIQGYRCWAGSPAFQVCSPRSGAA